MPAATDPSCPVALTLTVEDGPDRRLDVTMTAPLTATVRSVLSALRKVTGVTGQLWLEGRPLDLDDCWLSAGLRHGSVLRQAEQESTPVAGAVELRVVAGPSAGLVVPVPAAGATVGRLDCTLTLDDAEVSRRHAALTYGPDGLVVRDLDSTNGLAVDGVATTEACIVGPGVTLSLGESRVLVAEPCPDPAALADDGRGALVLNRPPRRIAPSLLPVEITLPIAPAGPERARVPLTALLVPLLLGAVLFLTMPSSPQYLLLMAMSPLMVVGNALADRKGGRRRHRDAVREHAAATIEADRTIAEACADEGRALHEAAPDPARLADWATVPSSRLWERRPADPDACSLRLGVADRPASVRLLATAGQLAQRESPLLHEVPAVLAVDEAGVLGLAGPSCATDGVTRWLVAQGAILLGPEALQVAVLTDEDRLAGWEWLRWLPHATRALAGQVRLARDEASHTALVSELLARGGKDPRLLLVVDRAHARRDVPGLAELLDRAPALGVLAVCTDVEERLLPRQCRAVAAFEPGSRTRLALRDGSGAVLTGVLADQVSPGWADRVARSLGRLARAAAAEDGGLPASGRLLELLELADPTAEQVLTGWLRGGRTTRAVLGWATDGEQAIDLATDGPHALVAGTTGAGKSELLQTLVASLASANRPDALQLVLVDYKGGAAFRDCARLPHTVGLVTDLDGRLTERALASLTAELRRRETVLAEHGAKDLEQLWAAQPPTATPVLPRLVIVIDEFATLVEELPDFVRGLVGIAQRGRSLGIHLVLATQRPGGVVSPDIRANTNLRICLRVTQATESSDVVDSAAAADVPARHPGRGYLRTGAGALQLFQAARVGGPWQGVAKADPGPVARVQDFASVTMGHKPAAPADPAAGPPVAAPSGVVTAGDRGGDDGPSDLSRLVDAICAASDVLGLAPPRRPWLDPLPEVLTLSSLTRPAPVAADADPVLTLGLLDQPAHQRQLPYELRLADGKHLLVAGAPRSGRSCVLQAVVASAVQTCGPGDLHLYALDFGNQGLAPLTGLPHCGAVVLRDEAERLERLLALLQTEVERRQRVLAAGGFADLVEQRRHAAPADRLPWMLLLVDRWEGFVQAYQDVDLGRRVDELLRLLREGLAVGLRAVVTSDRSGLLGRLPSVVPDRLLLRLTDRADYALADVPTREVPTNPPSGRALVLGEGPSRSFHEVQIALLAGDPDGRAQHEALRQVIETATGRSTPGDVGLDERRHVPLRVDALPRTVTEAEVLALGPTAAEASGAWALVGVGGDCLRPVGIDLAQDGPALLVAGPARSGRSTALVVIARSLLHAGSSVCVVAPPSSPLRQLAATSGFLGCLDAETSREAAEQLLTFAGRRPVVVLDDAERLTDSPVGVWLEEQLRSGTGPYVVAAGNSEDLQGIYRGFTLEVRRSRCGLLLNPQSTLDGDLVGVRLSRTGPAQRQPGRGLLAVRGELLPVQVALPAWTPTNIDAPTG